MVCQFPTVFRVFLVQFNINQTARCVFCTAGRRKVDLFFGIGLLVPDGQVDAGHLGGEGVAVLLLEVLPCPKHITQADIQQGQVAVDHQDIGKVAQVPQRAQIHAGDIGDDAEGDDEQADDADHIDEHLVGGNALGAHLGEGHEAHQAGVSEQAES